MISVSHTTSGTSYPHKVHKFVTYVFDSLYTPTARPVGIASPSPSACISASTVSLHLPPRRGTHDQLDERLRYALSPTVRTGLRLRQVRP